MRTHEIELTTIDRIVLDSYCSIVDGLAEYLGKGYEVVLHSLEDLDNSVIHIVNGEHTGRKVGAPITDKALKLLETFEKNQTSRSVYFSKNKKGETLKSTTIAIRGEKNRIIGLMCVNFYLDTPFSQVLSLFAASESNGMNYDENFAENVDELIALSLNAAKKIVSDDSDISSSNKNKAIVKILYERGIFNIKDAVLKVAEQLNISKNTVYMHLRNMQDINIENL